MEFKHIPVLLNETIKGLNINPDGIYVDGTLGGAGHSYEIAKRLSKNGRLIGIDRDQDALDAAEKRLNEFQNCEFVHGNHDDIKQILKNLNIDKVDGILFDLGVSSYQLDEKERGFSYLGDNVLDMRMDKSQKLSALDVVNKYEEKRLEKIIFEYGEEKFARQIARKICEVRKEKPVTTTKELVKIIEKARPYLKDGHPAKKTFQAIRIEVNNELEPLYNTVMNAIECLFVDAQGKCTCPKDLPYCVCNYKTLGKIITKKPIEASKEEIENNSRSKTAKLRIFERREKEVKKFD